MTLMMTEEEKRKAWRKHYVKERRTKAQRSRIYRKLRKAGIPTNTARAARDWTTGHIRRILKVTI